MSVAANLRAGYRRNPPARRRIVRHALLLLAVICHAAGAIAQPLAYVKFTESVELDGQVVLADVYRPGIEPFAAVAIVAHGFSRSRVRHFELGKALAAAGITAVIPDLPHTLDHWGNGDAVAELARKLEKGAVGLPPVERSRLLLIGTSAGGLATVLAAAKLPGLAGWIGLDPVDRTGTGVNAAAQITAPAVVLLADRSGCNLYGSGRSIARAVPGLLRATVLDGASHCDFEGPTNNFCRTMCGGSSSEMQARAREETVNAAVEILHRGGVEHALHPAAPPQ